MRQPLKVADPPPSSYPKLFFRPKFRTLELLQRRFAKLGNVVRTDCVNNAPSKGGYQENLLHGSSEHRAGQIRKMPWCCFVPRHGTLWGASNGPNNEFGNPLSGGEIPLTNEALICCGVGGAFRAN